MSLRRSESGRCGSAWRSGLGRLRRCPFTVLFPLLHLVLYLLLLVACGPGDRESAPPKPAHVVISAGDEDGSRHATETVTIFIPDGPHLENCVMHAGGGRSRREAGVMRVRCHQNAECTAVPGSGMVEPTDGFIDMACDGTACECVVQGGPEGSERHVTPFTIDGDCAGADRAVSLFTEYCMAGSEFARSTESAD